MAWTALIAIVPTIVLQALVDPARMGCPDCPRDLNLIGVAHEPEFVCAARRRERAVARRRTRPARGDPRLARPDGRSRRRRAAAIERNLHDGAQQRLIAVTLQLRMLADAVADDAVKEQIEAAVQEVTAALAELRDLAQGLHSSILADEGLGAAVEYLAERAPLPVSIDVADERYPEPIRRRPASGRRRDSTRCRTG